jgi:hypothetical protein
VENRWVLIALSLNFQPRDFSIINYRFAPSFIKSAATSSTSVDDGNKQGIGFGAIH